MPANRIDTQPFGDDLVWPEGRRIAVIFNLAYEAWSEGATSGVGPMGNLLADGLFDPNADCYGRYNATHGIPRLVSILERHGIPASLMTSGLVASDHPQTLRDFAAAGHDIVAHGFAQDMVFPTLSAGEAEHSIVETTARIEAALGQRPAGWISPRVTSGPSVQHRLAELGYAWHGDVIDDDRPYVQRFGASNILAIPMSVEFNDLPHAMRFGRTPGQFVELFGTALEGIKRQPPETIILDVFAHGHCYGRPAAAWAIDEIARLCNADRDLWLTTRSEIAAHCVDVRRNAA
ncbi:polysaccharide deacetylase family protein [Roseivivax sp. GX 12232]|uniref:polysaccharide deacetylase family protein n=1 Tax=Roseivivax sp. GX 12232 TaxID=2900547 RepID=UPI001E2FB8B5|nr:polysaccharide deacetylase family protein [Roseivivax sp. GX 12232]MCE0507309.1 polysaccharide deacetylase family protein [Roseivivax sp. GX 12232]